mmetsp:Transcript_27215/g.63383  ORF Transcript_27215/g.63383 Transcript_27215/m.63383 type:complete len:352 (+) Transcript_27215:64-1119(+)
MSYPPGAEEDSPLGRGEYDHATIFPKYSTAAPSSTSETVVNGKTLNIWEYGQLENLSVPVLRQRALVLRDTVGEASCPVMPSTQRMDLIRWILHVQNEITSGSLRAGRSGAGVPRSFLAENQERPLSPDRAASQRAKPAPFGPRSARTDFQAARDNYGQMLQQQHDMGDAVAGVASNDAKVNGRRAIATAETLKSNGMKACVSDGVDDATGRPLEGRRYLGCKDSIGEHRKEAERGGPPAPNIRRGAESTRGDADGMRSVFSPTNGSGVAAAIGSSAPDDHWLGDRKKRVDMAGRGGAAAPSAQDVQPAAGAAPRRAPFAGPDGNFKGVDPQYKPNWRQDPSRLMGSSLLV